MDTLTSSELELMGISPDKSNKLIFRGREFVIGPSFSTNNKGISVNFCIQEEKQGHRCLLVESSSSITVWKSVKTVKSKPENHQSSESKKEELVDHCRLELTKCIGPMAALIVDELEDEANNMSQIQFVDMIAEQIPDSKIALAFKKSMS
jgi:hypothetical protein